MIGTKRTATRFAVAVVAVLVSLAGIGAAAAQPYRVCEFRGGVRENGDLIPNGRFYRQFGADTNKLALAARAACEQSEGAKGCESLGCNDIQQSDAHRFQTGVIMNTLAIAPGATYCEYRGGQTGGPAGFWYDGDIFLGVDADPVRAQEIAQKACLKAKGFMTGCLQMLCRTRPAAKSGPSSVSVGAPNTTTNNAMTSGGSTSGNAFTGNAGFGGKSNASAGFGGNAGVGANGGKPVGNPAKPNPFAVTMKRFRIEGGGMNKSLCADVMNGDLRPGTIVWVWGCNFAPAQNFVIDTQTGRISPQKNTALCVDDTPGQGLALVDCGAVRFRWSYDPLKHAVHNNAGRCWDVRRGEYKPGTRLIMWPCHGKMPQRFQAM